MRTADQYLAALDKLPEVLVHLAALSSPTRQQTDGQPVAREVQQVPVRLMPLDDLSQIFVELWRAERAWRGQLRRVDLLDTAHMVSFDQWGDWDEGALHPRGILTDDHAQEQLKLWAETLVNRLHMYWPAIVQHPDWSGWVVQLDEWAVKMPARWPLEQRAPVRAQPRECTVCGERDVFASAWDPTSALCYSCDAVFRPEEWLPLRTAAERIGKGLTTVKRWAESGEIRVLPGAPARHPHSIASRGEPRTVGRHVEMNELRAHAAVVDARNPSKAAHGGPLVG